jgi:formylglycine-generating enzyme required for sulfatase activity
MTPLEALLAPILAAQVLAPAVATSCPTGMRLIDAIHYEYVQRICTDFHADHCFAFWRDFVGMEPRETPVHACMDEYEWPNQKGAEPTVMLNFLEAEAACGTVHKRLCTEFEWESACEAPDVRPFPYGFERKANVCNSDKTYRPVSEAKLASADVALRTREALRAWQGEGSGARPECVSPSGIYDMTGNVEEWVRTSRPEWAYPSSLKGGYWSKPWAGCRGTNDSHGPRFRFYEVGFRCCADPT